MRPEDIKRTIIECFEDENFISCLHERLLAPIVSRHVAEAMEVSSREVEFLRVQLTAVRSELDSLEQYSRRNSLTISGLPETEQENTDTLVIDVARAAGVTATVADLDRSHRVGQLRRGRPRQIIAKFVSFNKRQELLEARRNMRAGRVPHHPTLTQQVLAQTFIAENLTRKNQLILFVARQLRRKGKLHSAWTNNCQIKVRAREGGPTIKIYSLLNLRDVVGDDPDVMSALKDSGDTAAPTPRPGPAPASPVTGAAAPRAPGERVAPEPGRAPGASPRAPPSAPVAAPASSAENDTAEPAVSAPSAGVGDNSTPLEPPTVPALQAEPAPQPSGAGESPSGAEAESTSVGAGASGAEQGAGAAAASPERAAGGSEPSPGVVSASPSVSPVTVEDLPATPNSTGGATPGRGGTAASRGRGGRRRRK